MKASVIIPTHNRRRGLAELLIDLQAQELGPLELEVIVVDSLEGEPVESLVLERAASGLDVRVLLTDNVVSTKRNYGAASAAGEVLIFLDDDMRVGPTFVRAHADAHQGDHQVISGAIDFPDEWVRDSNYYRYKDSRHRSPRTKGRHVQQISPHKVVTMNMSLHRSSFHTSGGFDASFVRYGGEDLEFGYRCARLGLQLLYSPSPTAWHYETTASVRGFAVKLYVATYFGTPLLLKKAPEARTVKTFKWTEPGLSKSRVDRIAAVVLAVVSRPVLVRAVLATLMRVDKLSWAYCPAAYKAFTMLVVRVAVSDRMKGMCRPGLFE